jgi:prepilin-type N-terminal cleavage/methylation domain-containing protein
MKEKACQQGFTLVELLIAMVILGVVLTGVVRMFSNTNKYNSSQEMLVDLTQDLRAVKQLMTQELREAGCNPETKGSYGFQMNAADSYDTDSNSVHFTRDIGNGSGSVPEPDGDADDANENISYHRTNDNCSGAVGTVMVAGDNNKGCLRRRDHNISLIDEPVMPNVIEFQLRYFDENDMDITAGMISKGDLEKIRTVNVFIRAEVEYPDKVRDQIKSQEMDFRVLIRNF